MKEFINMVLAGEELSQEQAGQAMEQIMIGEATSAQIAGLLVALRSRGEAPQEVAGFVATMRRHAVPIRLEDANAVDGCGTGGDYSNTFNISTAASLVASAAGATVAKHGNRSVSSQCGSADLLEAIGGTINPGAETVQRNIAEVGFGFMFAPAFHPSMKHAAGPRRELGVRTVFNILGPMTNPAGVTRQIIGVYDKGLLSLVVDAMEIGGAKHVIVAHSHDGLDEFSVAGPTGYIELRDGRRDRRVITPEDVGLKRHTTKALAGGDAAANADILSRVLKGEQGAYRDAVVLNAGAILYVASKANSIADGVRLSEQAVDSGAGLAKRDAWVAASAAK